MSGETMMPDTPHPRTGDLFPRTESGYLLEAVQGGDGRLAARFVMRVYLRPLAGYFSAMRFSRMGQPDDIVAGFFADRLGRPDWISKWFEERERSGMRFSRWLLTSFGHYLYEEARRRKRDGRVPSMDPATIAESELLVAPEQGEGARVLERARAESILAEAIARARDADAAQPLDASLAIFEEHFLKDRPYADIAEDRGLDIARAKVAARTGGRRLRAYLLQVLLDEGIEKADLDDEIGRLMSAFES